ncbi:protein SMALL AUXIN UP-REGULATED RNA 10-like [Punica granatum]|uniref:Uncharacterized protein n=2 Tax=Punica granatum TaxID=22663 RepID=A0A218XB54_PUNGR|nr:protein SMALL AUXIN UP-REGULATED RNA 10-like [Punica granatum]OWM81936.1 hypothetical protein CDL15_Pgr007975 [Punica granatum]PKI74500.1 hypothetical protein CRG98_005120 [Punica granatum]
MDSRKSNKISDIVRLQRMLKKWKKLAKNGSGGGTSTAPAASLSGFSSATASAISTSNGGSSKSIKFLKRTLSFTDVVSGSSASSSSSSDAVVPKGFLAVCVGKELKRFVIPMEYLRHQAFGILLQEAEEEFGFQQEGVLKIPCQVTVFEKILKAVEEKSDVFFGHDYTTDEDTVGYCSSSDCELPPSHHAQMCR